MGKSQPRPFSRIPILGLIAIIALTPILLPSLGAQASDSASAEILSHSSYMRYGKYKEFFTGKIYEGDFFHVVGEVQNIAAENIVVEVVPVFYDETGAVIEAEPIHTSIKPLEILAPDQKSPFEMIILDEDA
ncbi:MAG: hypothetical protein ACE5OY_09140, partial [Candidatus Bathyarchaeia archaeon]